MKRKDFLGKVLAGGLGITGFGTFNEGSVWDKSIDKKIPNKRLRKNIDLDWCFHLGDVKGAEKPSYPDQNWCLLDLPHDWSIEGKFNKNNPSGSHGAYLPGGIGWYRKEIQWNPNWEKRNVFIDFDGVYMNSDVWINGHHLGHRPCGFISFRYDITPYLLEGRNVVAVRVDNSKQPSARWYTGSGIYRHVWLNVTHPIHVGHWGTYVTTPVVSSDLASVKMQTCVDNNTKHIARIKVEQVIRARNGYMISHDQKEIVIKASSNITINHELTVPYPLLWSPNEPNMYELETILKKGKEEIDHYITPFGIRKLEFSSKWGFRINGVPTLIKGTCNHDGGGGAVGAAVPDDELYYRLNLLKEMGSNAIRTSHNPRSPEFYTFCDVLGIMVLDEAFDGWSTPKAKYDYGLYFDKWWKKDLGSFIRRDRNHPCVIMWSIGNEVKGFTDNMQKTMVGFVHNMDDSRLVTQGVTGGRGNMEHLDVAGFNGNGEEKGVLETYHKKKPHLPIIGTEMTHTLQTRGVYRTQSWYRIGFPKWAKGHIDVKREKKIYPVPNLSKKEIFMGIPEIYKSSYDNCIVRIDVRDQYKHDSRYAFLMGSFRWSGFDYLGEAINQWPTRAGNFGIIDLAGIPKDDYYLYQSLWRTKPMVHILPHWTHPGKEGVKIPVVAYSNCSRVELFFNGKSLGEKQMGDALQLVWNVPYQSGMLIAVAKDANGQKLAETAQQTADNPYRLKVRANRFIMRANRREVTRLEVSVVDKNGVLVPDADNYVEFDTQGHGKIIGVENGDIADMNSTKSNIRKVFHGKCIGLIKAGNQAGTCMVHISSKGLKSDKIMIMVK